MAQTLHQIMEIMDRVHSNAREQRADHLQDWLCYMTMTQGPSQSVYWDDIVTPFVPDYLKLPEGM